jgi:TetR/AcrR family transcriptional regulator, mexJK operon transcriptional repressor
MGRVSDLAGRGRIDRRQAIVDAAFTVFAREGYARTGMQEIAATAAVAKPTIYNHFQDKEALFRAALSAAAEVVSARNLAAIEDLTAPTEDLVAVFERVAYRLVQSCCTEDSRALRRLAQAEANNFPDLLKLVHSRTGGRLTTALAGRLAQLALSGQLRTCAPVAAAEQFLALLTAPMDLRSQLGTRKVPTAETRAVARSAANTFLRAYGTVVPELSIA